MDAVREAVMRRIDELADEAVELTREMVRIDSRNPSLPGVERAEVIGGESRVNDLLEGRYAARLVASGGSTDRTVRGTLKVKVPLLGGKVEHAIVDGLRDIADAQQGLVQQYLSGAG